MIGTAVVLACVRSEPVRSAATAIRPSVNPHLSQAAQQAAPEAHQQPTGDPAQRLLGRWLPYQAHGIVFVAGTRAAIFDAKTGRIALTLVEQSNEPFDCAVVGPDRKLILTVGAHGTLALWSGNGERLLALPEAVKLNQADSYAACGNKSSLANRVSVEFSRSGDRLVTVTTTPDNHLAQAHIWNPGSASALALDAPRTTYPSLALAPDGEHVRITDDESSNYVYSTVTGALVARFPAFTVQWSPGGDRTVTLAGGEDGPPTTSPIRGEQSSSSRSMTRAASTGLERPWYFWTTPCRSRREHVLDFCTACCRRRSQRKRSAAGPTQSPTDLGGSVSCGYRYMVAETLPSGWTSRIGMVPAMVILASAPPTNCSITRRSAAASSKRTSTRQRLPRHSNESTCNPSISGSLKAFQSDDASFRD
jgi:hypothetical protein